MSESLIPPDYRGTSIEDVDRAVRDWFDKTVNAHVKTPQEEQHKVPVIFSSGERWSTGRTKQAFRDENGVLILPIISIRRTSVEPDPSKMSLGIQVDKIQIAKQVDPKTNQVKNLLARQVEGRDYRTTQPKGGVLYDVYTIPFPDRMQVSYQLVVQAQFISQMNSILQKVWRSLDIQKSFVAVFDNDGRLAPRVNQFDQPYEPVKALPGRYVVGFMESTHNDGGNFEEFTDSERIVKYTTDIKVPCVLTAAVEGHPAPVKVERTAYKLVLKTEVVTQVDNPDDLEKIFGSSR